MHEKLNKTLAKWAGVEEHKVYIHDPMDYPEHKQILVGSSYPRFTDSLDACFRELVPKVEGISITATIDGWECDIHLGDYVAEAETPSLAVCLAIEKLIKVKD